MQGEGKEETLPPGFRFHPTDEELITCYLIQKISDASFTGRAIADVDLNKCEPWDLPGKAKMGEKEWYFFSLRDRKYPTGVRTNRATNTGYWKTTGKDKEILNSLSSELIGMKKTLVFYRGRAPRGEKSNWVMHEYRIHSKSGFRTPKDEWVVCRVFQKSPGAKNLKYPSNHHNSRGTINPYNLEIGPSHSGGIGMPPVQSHVMQQEYPVDAYQYQSGRAYVNYTDLPELTRVFRGGGSSTSIPMQSHQLNYPIVGGGGGFTISGLNLNLGGEAIAPQFLQPHHPTGMSNDDLLAIGNEAMGYDGDNNTNKFMGGINHCADLDNYWPSY